MENREQLKESLSNNGFLDDLKNVNNYVIAFEHYLNKVENNENLNNEIVIILGPIIKRIFKDIELDLDEVVIHKKVDKLIKSINREAKQFLEDNWEAIHVYFSKEEAECNFVEFMVDKYKF